MAKRKRCNTMKTTGYYARAKRKARLKEETAEQKELRLAKGREKRHLKYQRETPEERQERLLKGRCYYEIDRKNREIRNKHKRKIKNRDLAKTECKVNHSISTTSDTLNKSKTNNLVPVRTNNLLPVGTFFVIFPKGTLPTCGSQSEPESILPDIEPPSTILSPVNIKTEPSVNSDCYENNCPVSDIAVPTINQVKPEPESILSDLEQQSTLIPAIKIKKEIDY